MNFMNDISPELNQAPPKKDNRSVKSRLKKVAGKVVMGTPIAGLILSSGTVDNPSVPIPKIKEPTPASTHITPPPTSETPAFTQSIDRSLEITDRYVFTSTKEGFLFQKDKALKPEDIVCQVNEHRRDVSNERVVRVFLNGSSGGVGWIMDDGYVLTVAHVLGDEGLREIKLSDGKIIKIKIVSADREKDLALVKYETYENKFEGTEIGIYPEGRSLTMMTLDNASDENVVSSQKAAESSNTRILTNNEMQKEAMPSTPQDLALGGMSGSAYLDEEGHLVGVLKESGVSSGGWPGNKIDKAPYNVLVPSNEIIKFLQKIQIR